MTKLLHHNWAQAKHLQVLIRTIAQTFVDNLKKKNKQTKKKNRETSTCQLIVEATVAQQHDYGLCLPGLKICPELHAECENGTFGENSWNFGEYSNAVAKGAILKKLSNLEKKIAKVLANFKLIAKNQMRWQRGLMANGDFDAYGQVFKKIGEKFKWSGKGAS